MSMFQLTQRVAVLESQVGDIRHRLSEIERGYDRLLERLVALIGLSDEGLPRFTPLADALLAVEDEVQ